MANKDGHELPASHIPVSLFREILIWPLALHLSDESNDANAMAIAVQRIAKGIGAEAGGSWQRIEDPLEHIAAPTVRANTEEHSKKRDHWQADAYAEGVYFHQFVQNFLFAKTPDDLSPPPLSLFRRTDIAAVEVDLHGTMPYRLAVERLNLYLFCTGAALLVLEICYHPGRGNSSPTWCLSDVQNFHDRFRRAYVPFADKSGPLLGLPHLVPCSVVWRGNESNELKRCSLADELADMIGSYVQPPPPNDPDGRRFPPVFEHWRWLLPKSLLLPPQQPDKTGRWHHVLDERMATLAAVAVAGRDGDELYHYHGTRRGDLVRLCFADDAGPAAYGYDQSELEDFEKRHAYRLFAGRGTLYLSSGYAFVAYGAGGEFENFVAAVHMRRHYFQMWLLAQFELTTLLTFSSRISHAVHRYDPARMPEEWFEQRMRIIQEEFLQFVHRFRFTGVSNHVQAQALFSLMRRHLHLDQLFADIQAEIESATEFLFSRATTRGADMTERLTVIGTIAVIAGLAFSALGMNILAQPKPIAYLLTRVYVSQEMLEGQPWAGLAITSVVIAAFAALGGGLLSRVRRHKEDRRNLPHRRGGRLAAIANATDESRRGLPLRRDRRPPRFDEIVERCIWRAAQGLFALAAIFLLVALIASSPQPIP